MRSGNSETDGVVGDDRDATYASGGAKGYCIPVPDAAAKNAAAAVGAGACTAITRVAGVLLVPAVLGPLPNVTVHIIEVPGVGRETVYRHCRLAPFAL